MILNNEYIPNNKVLGVTVGEDVFTNDLTLGQIRTEEAYKRGRILDIADAITWTQVF